jgi:hypothetical protein
LYRFKFLALFCELGLKMLGPQQWQLLHVEKDDQVIRHNNNKTKEKSIRKAFLFNVRPLRIVPRKNICFVFLAWSCFHYSCVYDFLSKKTGNGITL